MRAWVESTLGSPLTEAVDQVGGMSPGCATRVRTADGRRAFVKAVGAEINADTPTLFRREAAVLGAIGDDDLWAPLLATRDADGWVALLLEDVEGHHLDAGSDSQVAALLAATDALGERLSAHAPPPQAVDLRVGFARWADALDRVAALDDAPAPAWLGGLAPRWSDRVRSLAATGPPRLLHADIRNDNLLVDPAGRVRFVDWGMAAAGPAWQDPLLARLERCEDAWFDAAVADHPALAALGDDAVTAWLLGLGAHLAVRAATALDVNLPTLAQFRVRESGRFLGAAARRLGRA